MHAPHTMIPRGRSWPLMLAALVGLGLAIACLSGCGKSQAELDADQAAEDARFDAAAAAERDRESKLNHEAYAAPAPDARPTPKISPAMAAALSLSRTRMSTQAPSDTSQHSSSSGQPSAVSDSELHEMYQQMMGNVRRNLPQSNNNRFFDADMNRSHTAVCGSVDYEVWSSDGVRGRSKRQRFYATMSDAMVDTDAPGVHATFERMISNIDCTPGMWRDTSQ